MADKSGMNINAMKPIVKNLKEIVKNYKTAMDNFANDLNKVQTTGSGGQPVWNGTRAKKWLTKAINDCYKTNADTLVYLDKLCTDFSDEIKNYEGADSGSSSGKSSSKKEEVDSISNWDLIN